MGDYGMRVAKPGYDALVDSDANMAFTSKRYSDKVLAGVVLSTSISGTTGSVTYNHGLGYAPQFMVFYSEKNNSQIPTWWSASGGTPEVTADAVCNSTSLTVNWIFTVAPASAVTVTAIILILEKSL